MKELLIVLMFYTGCATVPDYAKAMNECSLQMDAEDYNFTRYNTHGDEYWTGKVEGLEIGYFEGCVDAKTRYK